MKLDESLENGTPWYQTYVDFAKKYNILDKEYEDFKYRHSLATVGKAELENYEGECFLGIDAGSTTIKFVVVVWIHCPFSLIAV